MLPKYHIVIGGITSLLLYYSFSLTIFQTLIIFFASFIIDVDHYFLYVLRQKDFSLNNARSYFKKKRDERIKMPVVQRRKHKRFLYIFHGIEFWILIFALTYLSTIFWFILIGFAVHMVLDWLDFLILGDPLIEKFSQSATYLRNRGKKEFI